MNKEELLNKYKKQEDKLLIAKLLDKIEFSAKYNKISNTDFLSMYEQKLLEKVLKHIKFDNYIIYGGKENTERNMIFIYPSKFENLNKEKIILGKIEAIRIDLPIQDYDKFTHKNYLGAVIKLGVKREKIGDILVEKNGADIIVSSEISKYLIDNLKLLKRFSGAKIEKIQIENLREIIINKKEIQIIISSLRLDNIISELTKTSREKAKEILQEERVFINFENETKNTKIVQEGDIITIRGKGRFVIKEIIGKTKKDNIILSVEQYI